MIFLNYLYMQTKYKVCEQREWFYVNRLQSLSFSKTFHRKNKKRQEDTTVVRASDACTRGI